MAVCVALIAGCGSSNTKPIPHGVATGAGFSVSLPSSWRSFDQAAQKKISQETQQQANAKGIPVAGVLEAGHWINPSGAADDSLVVDVEPVTTDTSDATISQEQSGVLKQAGAVAVRQLSSQPTVDGVPATGFAYRLGGFELRVLSVRRGTYLYSITVGGKAGQGVNIDSLLGTLVKAWHWTSTAVPALAQLDRYSGHGYDVTLPPGWRGAGSKDAALAGVKGADSVWSGYTDASGRSVVAVFERPAGNATLDQLAAEEIKNGGRRKADDQLGGADAAVLDISSQGVHLHEWVAVHGGVEYAVVVRTTEARRALDDAAVRKALDSWRFTG